MKGFSKEMVEGHEMSACKTAKFSQDLRQSQS